MEHSTCRCVCSCANVIVIFALDCTKMSCVKVDRKLSRILAQKKAHTLYITMAHAVIDRMKSRGAADTSVTIPDQNDRTPRHSDYIHNSPTGNIREVMQSTQDTQCSNYHVLRSSVQMMHQTNNVANETLEELARQGDMLDRTHEKTDQLAANLSQTQRVLRDMKRHLLKERVIKFGIIGAELVTIAIICYSKFYK